MILEIKKLCTGDHQWRLFERMMALVKLGTIVFPSQVHREIAEQKHPDTPGSWCAEARRHVARSDARDETMAEILNAVDDLVEALADADREPADPYIVAMAYELTQESFDVAVATVDCVDRMPVKIALTTACDRLEITTWDFETFVAWLESIDLP